MWAAAFFGAMIQALFGHGSRGDVLLRLYALATTILLVYQLAGPSSPAALRTEPCLPPRLAPLAGHFNVSSYKGDIVETNAPGTGAWGGEVPA